VGDWLIAPTQLRTVRPSPFCAASQAFFWRTSQGDEVDLLMDLGKRKVPFEIKLHSAPVAQDGERLRRCMKSLHLKQSYLVHAGRQAYSLGEGVIALPAGDILSRPQDIAQL
jgi:predicted AAA+ superfamily ATPase